MHHLLSKAFSTGTWFSTFLFFFSEYVVDADAVYKSIIAVLSLVLLVLQLTNQWNIRQDRKEKKMQEGKIILLDKQNSYGEFKDSIVAQHENLKKNEPNFNKLNNSES